MTIRFNEQEWNNIDKIPFAWRISPNCPESVRKTLAPKLDLLKEKSGMTAEQTSLTDKPTYLA